ncbi:Starch-binding associating with outer membrane [Pustulibacterium marinum]|uniref:Starch-binding associating with outer membrane n=1 Tax=Pustulibacterium marinum TaxID=1224947 RepID=A0A1I7FS96_9FLAO|nr:RagB/SusD family nutrient uptake outer membrane protein [Pustulibacterium marinum]SFU39033.1 Starch-binding associating with outer membrane [Pustulibacterium marinum]
MKKFIYSIFILSALASCSESFLEEEMVATLTQQRYDTPEGIEELVNGAYEGLRFHFNYEWSYALTNYGTDTFTNAAGTNHVHYNTYSGNLNSLETANLKPYWDNMYAQINLQNIGISKIPTVLANSNETLRNTRLGELYFLRGFDYYKLVTQFGGVPISVDPITSDIADFPRATKAEVFDLIIADLTTAVDLLPEVESQEGRITKAAAQHFLAKAYLTRASELNADITESSDLQNAADYAMEVIENSPNSLASDYNDLFEYTSVNGPNETNSEIILAAQFDNNQSLLGRYGNQTHLYFLSVYRFFPGMTRNLNDGREFQRLRPTEYGLDVFDRKNDSRFYKSFQTSYIAQNTNNVPVWDSENAPSPDLVGQLKFSVGDTAAIYIINEEDDTRFTEDFKDSYAPLILARYSFNESGSATTDWDISTYPSLSKYLDPFRTNYNDAKGTRDGIIARLSETYLIAAEAYGRMGNYSQAVNLINEVRERAAYKAGEDRGWVYYLAENIDDSTMESTQNEMTITEDVFTPGTTASNEEIYPSGVSSKPEMFIHYILNERARELMGEFHRWVDLSRTETLVQRAQAFNPDAAANVAEKFLLRPIPQSYIDALQSNGQPLSQEEREEVQNPGY